MVVPFRWVGELGYLFVPVTGDYYVRARVYKPSIGRWISQDPLGFVDGLSLFVYSQNRLIIFVDPNGHHLIPPDELLPDIRPVDLLDAELSLLGCRCAGGTITFSVDPYTVRRSRTTGESNLCTRVRFHAEFEPNARQRAVAASTGNGLKTILTSALFTIWVPVMPLSRLQRNIHARTTSTGVAIGFPSGNPKTTLVVATTVKIVQEGEM